LRERYLVALPARSVVAFVALQWQSTAPALPRTHIPAFLVNPPSSSALRSPSDSSPASGTAEPETKQARPYGRARSHHTSLAPAITPPSRYRGTHSNCENIMPDTSPPFQSGHQSPLELCFAISSSALIRFSSTSVSRNLTAVSSTHFADCIRTPGVC
jgi:hypothetical protein